MIKVAKIINTRGLKGECKLYLYTDSPDHRFKKGQTLYVEKEQPLNVLSFSMHKGFGFVKFDQITTIEQAQSLKTKDLYISKEDLPKLDKGHYYYHELMDCDVVNQDNQPLGKVTDILETGVHPVLRIGSGKQSILVPYVPTFIVKVDIEKKMIVIQEMEGLR